jgi:two-component system, NtrC family, response regulator HydG
MAHALIVDDDPNFRLGLAEVLRREGFVTIAVSTREEAARELEKGAPDVLFLDVNLPDGSGLDLLPGPEAPTVVVTGDASLSLADKVLELGAWDCLAKPVDRLRVRMTLAGLARERRLRAELDRLRAELAALRTSGLVSEFSTRFREGRTAADARLRTRGRR